ncbi:MAG: hypothetical protein BGP21_03425 [Thiobacillus sp. 65-29]|nr:MAG: hypothetical protein BGP21_03425 [Thiobacillus sp. 65-29]
MWARIVKIVLSLPALIAAGVFAAYVAFGFLLVNPLAQKLLPWIGENKLASQLSAQQVTFNPFTLEATVDGLKLAEPDGKPLASFERLYVNLDTGGLFRWAWRIRDIQLDAPRAVLEVRPGGTLNWKALIDKLNEDKKPPSDTIARLLIDHIRIDQGNIEYTDANRPGEPFKAALAPLGIELDGLSTLPEDRGDYLIAARLPEQGGTLRWKGDVGLNPVVSSGNVQLEGVRLANLVRVIKKAELPFMPGAGEINAAWTYAAAIVKDKPQAVVSGLHFVLDGLAGTLAGGDGRVATKRLEVNVPRLDFSMPAGPQVVFKGLGLTLREAALTRGETALMRLDQAEVAGVDFDLAQRSAHVAKVSFDGAELRAARDGQGRIDWQQALPAPAPAPAPASAADPAPADAGAPFRFDVAELRLNDWKAQFVDRSFHHPLSVTIDDLDLALALSNRDGPLRLANIESGIGPFTVTSGVAAEPAATLARVKIDGGEADLDGQAVSVRGLTLSGLRARVVQTPGQPLNWQAMLASRLPPAPTKPAAAAPAWKLALARLALEDAAVQVEDRATKPAVRLDIEHGSVETRDVSLDLARPLEVKAALRVKQGGRLDVQGRVTPAPARGDLRVTLTGLSLKPFAPYVNQFARLTLHSGAASTRGRVKFSPAKTGMKLGYDGGFAVENLAITEEDTAEAFLGWEKLASPSLSLTLSPNRLHMGELVVTNPFGKVIIFEDKTLNLQRIRRAPAAPASPVPAAAPAAKTAEDETFPLVIERLRISGANAEFADLSLTPQFGTHMHELGGVITGLSTDPATTAQVELDGKVDDYGSARVRGAIHPFRATDFTDLRLGFRNLEMTNLTPYSGKFAGRRIDSGKLSVDLEYKIKDRQLAGENKFIVNKLKLGERVESPDAMKLPLDLAIALLEDSNGVIDLDLPVSGNLDDPQFSYGRIIWKAIVNVLTKLVTAPFRALGKLLGGSGEKFEAVAFDPGRSALLPPEQEKLKTLADALAKRPALVLTLAPGYDPATDRRALQEQAIRREAAVVAGVKLAPGEAPGPVDVNHYKVQTWLEDRYSALAGKEEYQKLRAGFRPKDAGAASRVLESQLVERIGRQFKTRDEGPASAFHVELLERLTRETKIPDGALIELARVRGAAMRDALVTLGLDPARVTVAAPVEQEPKDRLVPSKLELGVAGRGAPAPAVPQKPLPQGVP